MPLGWYYGPIWEKMYGENWASKFCNSDIDAEFRHYESAFDYCPCIVQHAMADIGKFIPQPDRDCRNQFKDCRKNTNEIKCYRFGNEQLFRTDKQCCYGADDYLLNSQDDEDVSSTQSSHIGGPKSSLRNWYQDLQPYFFCCHWQDHDSDDCRAYRTKFRPSTGCKGYVAPKTAGVFGNLHVVTFDGNSYNFNGLGDFILAEIRKDSLFKFHGRFEQVINNKMEIMATELTTIVAQLWQLTAVEVRLRPKDRQHRYKLDVFINGIPIYFNEPEKKVQHFQGRRTTK